MNFKKLNGTPCGAVRIDGDEILTLHDGSTVEASDGLVKPDDVRTLVTTMFIHLANSKKGGRG